MSKKRIPKRVTKVSTKHPDKNLKLHLFEAKSGKSKLVSAKPIGVRAAAKVAKLIKTSKGSMVNVD